MSERATFLPCLVVVERDGERSQKLVPKWRRRQPCARTLIILIHPHLGQPASCLDSAPPTSAHVYCSADPPSCTPPRPPTPSATSTNVPPPVVSPRNPQRTERAADVSLRSITHAGVRHSSKAGHGALRSFVASLANSSSIHSRSQSSGRLLLAPVAQSFTRGFLVASLLLRLVAEDSIRSSTSLPSSQN